MTRSAPDTHPTHRLPARGLWIALALVAALTLPAALAIWLLIILPLEVGASAALHDGSLSGAQALVDGWTAAWTINLSVLGWCALRRVRHRRRPERQPWWPLAGCAGLYGVALLASAIAGRLELVTAPPAVVAWARLGALNLLGLMPPLAGGLLSLRLATLLWRAARPPPSARMA